MRAVVAAALLLIACGDDVEHEPDHGTSIDLSASIDLSTSSDLSASSDLSPIADLLSPPDSAPSPDSSTSDGGSAFACTIYSSYTPGAVNPSCGTGKVCCATASSSFCYTPPVNPTFDWPCPMAAPPSSPACDHASQCNWAISYDLMYCCPTSKPGVGRCAANGGAGCVDNQLCGGGPGTITCPVGSTCVGGQCTLM